MFYEVKDIVKDSFGTIERLYEKKELITGVPTGFTELDRLTSGFQPSDLIIITGGPGVGKTTCCLSIARYAAIDAKIPVAIFSPWTNKEQLTLRMLCSTAKLNIARLRGGFLSESDWPKLTKAAEVLKEARILIDDTAKISVKEISEKSKGLNLDPGLIIVDHIELLMTGNGSEGRRELQDICIELKTLAKELNVPLVAVSQQPQLRDPGDVEYWSFSKVADVMIFIERDDTDKGAIQKMIVRNRNGVTGEVKY